MPIEQFVSYFQGYEDEIWANMSPGQKLNLIHRVEQKTASPEPWTYCRNWIPAKRAEEYGRIRASVPGKIKSKVLYAHRIKYKITHPMVTIKDWDVSHLCHNSRCVNPGHLILESREENNRRNMCKSVGKCLGHGNGQMCLFLGYYGQQIYSSSYW